MGSILIKDTTKEQREIRDINMEFRAHYESGMEAPERQGCGMIP